MINLCEMPYRMIDHLDAAAAARFMEKVDKRPDGCWYWTAATQHGYGVFSVREENGKNGRIRNYKAHRYAYALLREQPPVNRQLDHLCNVRHCVNPDHLKVVTAKENIRRSDARPFQLARRTHCKNGHEYTEDNIYRYRGYRECRACHRNRAKETRRQARLYRELIG
jgi:hypothetical protein